MYVLKPVTLELELTFMFLGEYVCVYVTGWVEGIRMEPRSGIVVAIG